MEGIGADSQMSGKRERDADSGFAAGLYIEGIFIGGPFSFCKNNLPLRGSRSYIPENIENRKCSKFSKKLG